MRLGRIIQDDSLLCPHGVADEALRRRRIIRRAVLKGDGLAVRPRRGFDSIAAFMREDQKAAIRAGALQGDRHQTLDQAVKKDFARESLGGLHNDGDVELLIRAAVSSARSRGSAAASHG